MITPTTSTLVIMRDLRGMEIIMLIIRGPHIASRESKLLGSAHRLNNYLGSYLNDGW